MTLTRREFLHSSGLVAAFAALPWLLNDPQQATLVNAPIWDAAPIPTHPTVIHGLNRITYGPRPSEVATVAAHGWKAFLEQQLNPKQIDDQATEQRLAGFPSLAMSNAERLEAYPPGREKSTKPGPGVAIRELLAASLIRAIYSERQLFEIMVDFWSNHLNIYINKNQVRWFKTSDDRDVIRTHAMGTFRDLLLASAKSPAMLIYLDNAHNVAKGRGSLDGINENYAREVMELHTVGAEGGYSEDDVFEVARTLTGWSIGGPNSDHPGEFVFQRNRHDAGSKRIAFLDLNIQAGSGLRGGEALLERLATHPNTAKRIAYKLAATFVSDTPPDSIVDRAAQAYLDSDTDIRQVLRVILNSDEFTAAAGQKIKLPLRALVSMTRAIGLDLPIGAERPLTTALQQLRNLGQIFFGWGPPNGYPQLGTAWVNANGMLARWNAAFALAEGQTNGAPTQLRQLAATASTAGTLVDTLSNALLQATLPDATRAALVGYASDQRGANQRLSKELLQRKTAGVAGLLLASPLFQLH
jgi:uncharacterized protein (DUF1800 family)